MKLRILRHLKTKTISVPEMGQHFQVPDIPLDILQQEVSSMNDDGTYEYKWIPVPIVEAK
jgi:hypothetical protein